MPSEKKPKRVPSTSETPKADLNKEVERIYGKGINEGIDELEIVVRGGRFHLRFEVSLVRLGVMLGGLGTTAAALVHWLGLPP